MSESLEELKRQKVEIERKIRSMTNIVCETENFVIRNETYKRISVNCRIKGAKTCKTIVTCKPTENIVEVIDGMIEQLERIREKLNNDSAS